MQISSLLKLEGEAVFTRDQQLWATINVVGNETHMTEELEGNYRNR